MHIGLIHMRHAPVGGTELVLNRVARHLAERDHDVTIVCRSHGEAPHPKVKFAVLRSAVMGAAWRMWAFAKDVEKHVTGGPYDVTLGLGKTWTHDVVRTGGGSHRTYLELAAPHVGGGWERRIGTRHLKDRLSMEIERRAYAPGAYSRVIANSTMVRNDIQRRYDVPDDRIEVVYNGVDLERFNPRHAERGEALRRALGLTPDQFVILFVGNGFGRKGLARLVDAMPLLLGARPSARLVVVGKDSTQSEYKRRAEHLGVDGAVLFLGERHDVEVCYAMADLFCLPTWYDSFAFSIVEAMASGLPVVTTQLAGAAELVEDGLQGTVLRGAAEPEELGTALVDWSREDRAAAAAESTRTRAEGYSIADSLSAVERILLEVAREPA